MLTTHICFTHFVSPEDDLHTLGVRSRASATSGSVLARKQRDFCLIVSLRPDAAHGRGRHFLNTTTDDMTVFKIVKYIKRTKKKGRRIGTTSS